MSSSTLDEVAALLYQEAAYIDEQKWDEWLLLYTEDCEFWLAAWKADHELTEDPTTEVSMMYYNRRSALEDRISRIRSGNSPASTPLPRTWHLVNQIRIDKRESDSLVVHAQWETHAYRFGETDTRYGRYRYRLKHVDGAWRIRSKKIVLINDLLDVPLDIYSI